MGLGDKCGRRPLLKKECKAEEFKGRSFQDVTSDDAQRRLRYSEPYHRLQRFWIDHRLRMTDLHFAGYGNVMCRVFLWKIQTALCSSGKDRDTKDQHEYSRPEPDSCDLVFMAR